MNPGQLYLFFPLQMKLFSNLEGLFNYWNYSTFQQPYWMTDKRVLFPTGSVLPVRIQSFCHLRPVFSCVLGCLSRQIERFLSLNTLASSLVSVFLVALSCRWTCSSFPCSLSSGFLNICSTCIFRHWLWELIWPLPNILFILFLLSSLLVLFSSVA